MQWIQACRGTPRADPAPLGDRVPFRTRNMNKYTLAALIAVCIYIAVISFTCFEKYRTFSYYDHDTAVFSQAMWNSLHGRFFYNSLFESMLLKIHGHFTALLLIPLYALWQSPLWLLYLQTIFLALAGWPIYAIARREIRSDGAAVAFLLLYLLYPALGYINLYHFYLENFTPFLLACTYYFYRIRKYPLFVTLLFAAVATREEISFIAIAMGVTALWEKRRAQWWLTPMVGGATWFAIYFFLLLPSLQASDKVWYLDFYSHLGDSAGDIAWNLITHPSLALGLMTQPQKLTYALHILAPLGFLPLLGPGILFIPLPVIVLSLLSTHPDMATILRHYNSPIIPFVFFAAIAGYARLLKFIRGRLPRALLLSAVVAGGLISSWMLGPQLHVFSRTWIGLEECLPMDDYLNPLRREMVSMIPPRVPVTATFPFFTHLTDRQELESLAWVLNGRVGLSPNAYVGRSNIEYALIDLCDVTTFLRYYDPIASPVRFGRFLSGNRLGLIKVCDRFALFRRNAQNVAPLYERVETDKSLKPLATFEGLELLDVSLAPLEDEKRRQLSFVSLWRADKKINDDLSMMILIADVTGKDAVPYQIRNICHHLYPTWAWREGETIRATHLIALPPSLQPGRYFLKMAVINKFPPCKARQYTAHAGIVAEDGWYIPVFIDL